MPGVDMIIFIHQRREFVRHQAMHHIPKLFEQARCQSENIHIHHLYGSTKALYKKRATEGQRSGIGWAGKIEESSPAKEPWENNQTNMPMILSLCLSSCFDSKLL